MTDFMSQLERDLVDAASRQRHRRRASKDSPRKWRPWRRLRSLFVPTAIFVMVSGTATGGTLLALRGDVISPPALQDVPRDQLPEAGTSRVASLRVADPAGGTAPPWTLRVVRSRTGLICSTVGQISQGSFGLVGMDGTFRRLPQRIVDGCGEVRDNRASLVGARVLDARRSEDVRTVVNGVGGSELKQVSVTAGGRRNAVRVAPGGAFVAVLAGYPEDLSAEVTLTFSDGHVERHPFGKSDFVVADPAGGRALKTTVFSFGSAPGEPANPETCVNFQPAREVRTPTVSPAACGVYPDPRRRSGYFFAVRRITSGTGGVPVLTAQGRWGDHPARTAVWGGVGEDIKRVEILGAQGERTEPVIAPNRAFLALFGPRVDSDALTVRVTFADGRVETRQGSTNLVPYPQPQG